MMARHIQNEQLEMKICSRCQQSLFYQFLFFAVNNVFTIRQRNVLKCVTQVKYDDYHNLSKMKNRDKNEKNIYINIYLKQKMAL